MLQNTVYQSNQTSACILYNSRYSIIYSAYMNMPVSRCCCLPCLFCLHWEQEKKWSLISCMCTQTWPLNPILILPLNKSVQHNPCWVRFMRKTHKGTILNHKFYVKSTQPKGGQKTRHGPFKHEWTCYVQGRGGEYGNVYYLTVSSSLKSKVMEKMYL